MSSLKKLKKTNSLRTAILVFITIALLWAVFARFFFLRAGEFGPFLGLWALSLLNLGSLALLFRAVFNFLGPKKDRTPLATLAAVQWGTLKLISLAALIGVLLKMGGQIPERALLSGIGTFLVIPLLGGAGIGILSKK